MAALKKLISLRLPLLLTIFLLSIVPLSPLRAQADSTDSVVVEENDTTEEAPMPDTPLVSHAKHALMYDSSAIVQRHISEAAMKKYQRDPDFDYMSSHLSGQGLLDRFFRWLGRFFDSIGENKKLSLVLKVLLYLGCGILVVFAAIRIAGLSENVLTSGLGSSSAVDYTVAHDDIYAINFNEAIQQAIADKQFRFAVRLLYLKSLRGLADKDIIQWKINKTNLQYLDELRDAPSYGPFASLTRIYEYVWYGEMPINEEQFNDLHQRFIHFSNNFA